MTAPVPNPTSQEPPQGGQPAEKPGRRLAWLAALLLCPAVPFVAVFIHYYRLYLPTPVTDWRRTSLLDRHLLEAAAASAAACLIVSALFLLVRHLLVKAGAVRDSGTRGVLLALLRLGSGAVIAVTGVYAWALGVKMYVQANGLRYFHAGWPCHFADSAQHGGVGWLRWHMVYDSLAWFVVIVAFYHLLPAAVRNTADRLAWRRAVRKWRDAEPGGRQ